MLVDHVVAHAHNVQSMLGLQSTVAKLLGARGVRSALEIVGTIVVLFTLSWQLAVVLLLVAPLLTPLVARLSKAIGGASKAAQAASADTSAAAEEIIENMKVVKLFAQQQHELRRFNGLLDRAHELAMKVSEPPRVHRQQPREHKQRSLALFERRHCSASGVL
jgi:ABC-type multidrug transport system fused ATPase/permease subunit